MKKKRGWSEKTRKKFNKSIKKFYQSVEGRNIVLKAAAKRKSIMYETGKKISAANKAFYVSPEGIKMRKKFTKERIGRKNSKTSLSLKAWYQTSEGIAFRRKRSESMKGKVLASKEGIERIRKVFLGKKRPPQVGIAVRRAQLGRKHTVEHIAKRQATMKIVKSQPEYWEKLQKGLKLRPNKFEQKVAKLLPNSFTYTGDFNPNGMFKFIDGRNKNADFTEFPNRTRVVECFGSYWHDHPDNIETTPEEHEQDIINSYKAIGVDCLIIWEKDMQNLETVKSKIQEFVHTMITKEL